MDMKTRIGETMKDCVRQWFTAEPLTIYSLMFIEEKLKESMMFGSLTLVHYHMFDGEGANEFETAAAVEMFILASDILDDLEDADMPHKPWMLVPQSIAMHVAVSLLTLSQQVLLDSVREDERKIRMIQMMNKQLLHSANGQMLDIVNSSADEKAYLEMVEQKSAALIVFACMAGVMAAGHLWHPIVANYAAELGMSAQLRNDLRDLLRWDEKNDFLQRKRTLLTLFLIEELQEEDHWISHYFHNGEAEDLFDHRKEDFIEACKKTGTILYGSVMSRMHYDRFLELLEEVRPDNPWKEQLLQIIDPKTA
ncbi:polyprenyl synthetase family protein [Paenibacillus sp. HB172176]|uniref:polyprenyl synthetase family protein n=1 Tax=Paenibacillus sp. HB172176 TaxID=2493690 RepID=UPI00143B9AAA|nr:polyprenyl synthetase family protein [Paenibacillus sp. HB172176]